MKVTPKQAYVLDNLHRIAFVQGRRKKRAILDGEDFFYQLVSLAAGGVIAWDRRGLPVRIGDPEGILAHMGRVRYPAAAE